MRKFISNYNLSFLKDGVVEEVGSHDSLMDAKGLYYSLVMLQNQMDIEEPEMDE